MSQDLCVSFPTCCALPNGMASCLHGQASQALSGVPQEHIKAMSRRWRRNKTLTTCIQTQAQAFKVIGNISHLFYFKHSCKDLVNDRVNVLLAVLDPYQSQMATKLGGWVACWGTTFSPWWAAQHWSRLPRKAGETPPLVGLWLTLSTGGSALSGSWPLEIPVNQPVWFSLLFLCCQHPFCLLISISHPLWHSCALTSRGSQLACCQHTSLELGVSPAWPFSPPNHSVSLYLILISWWLCSSC